jgi:Zn-finger nucleic acid-binding protein
MVILCRSCDREMDRVNRGPAHFWACESCGAHVLSESNVRKIVPPPVWAAIWPAIREAAAPGAPACPSCGRAMEETREVPEAGSLRVDWCEACRLVWLDPNELARMPKVPVAETPRLPAHVAKLIAKAIAAEYDERERRIFEPFKEYAVAIFCAFMARRGGLDDVFDVD